MKNIKKFTSFIAATGIFMLVFLASPMATQQIAAAEDCKPVSGLQIPKECQTYKCDIKNSANTDECLKANPITQWVVFLINLLGVLIIVGASAMLVFAGVEYIASADNPDRVKSAKQKITNVLIGIVTFFFLYAFLQWLIPGGVF